MQKSAYPPPIRPYPLSHRAKQVRRSKSPPRIPALGILLLKIAIGAALVGFMVVPPGILGGVYAYFQLSGRILPGTRVGGTNLGGKTAYEAAVELNKRWNMEGKMVVGALVEGEIHTWQFSAADLGLHVDPVKTAGIAFTQGRQGSVLEEIDHIIRAALIGWPIKPLVTFDPSTARASLNALSAGIDQPAKEASLTFDGNELIAVPGEAGYSLNIEKAIHTLSVDPGGVLLAGYLPLELQTSAPRVRDVSGAMQEARRLLDSPLTLRGYDPVTDQHFEWQIQSEEMASWLLMTPKGEEIEVGIDRNLVEQYLASLSDTIGPELWIDAQKYNDQLASAIGHSESFDLILNHKATTYKVKSGDNLTSIGWKLGIPYWMLVDANPGLNLNKLLAGQELVVPSKDELLPLPVIPNKRIVIDLSQQRLWVYQDGKQRKEFIISTGIDRSPTQPGVFQVQSHELNAYASVWDLYMPHFIGIYEAWPGFMNGIHGLPTLSSGQRLWANILGKPASYGCIILDLEAADWLYHWAENGVVVEIKP
jgi:LysM repeat protein